MSKNNKNNERITNWLKFKKLYFAISASLIAVSIFSLATYGVTLGVEFTGGSELTVSSQVEITTDSALEAMSELNVELSSVQKLGEKNYILKFSELNDASSSGILKNLQKINPEMAEVSFQKVGPSIGIELLKKTGYAILLAAVSILLWVAYQFKSIKFGASAILAMFHDTFILVGLFSLLGHFYNAEIDFLFVTAVLTTLSFSVHDTIVVFDRIREIKKATSDIEDNANKAVTETMRRSIINSLTIIFMLASLVILGGESIRWFATALLIGAVLGTYSSPFVAVPILVTWENWKKK